MSGPSTYECSAPALTRNGRVGMYGASYAGFAQWAAATHLPAALKVLMTSDATAPGIDFPMQRGVFQNWAFRWSFCVTHTRKSDQQICSDDGRWRALDQTWYRSGRRYRDLDGLPDLAALQSNIDSMLELGLAKDRVEVKNYVDLSLVKEAVQRLR